MADGPLDEDIVLSTICILRLDSKKQTKEEEKKRSTWVRPWLARRKERGFYHQLLTEITVEDTPAFRESLHMTETQFQGLVAGWLHGRLSLRFCRKNFSSGDVFLVIF